MKILVFTESSKGQLKRSSQELLQAAHKSGATVLAAYLGSDAGVASQAAHHGANEIHLFKYAKLEAYNPQLFAAALTELVKKTGASVVLGSASSVGRDLFPKVAAQLEAGLVSDATELQISAETLSLKKPMYSGKCFASATFNSAVKMVLMRANQLPVGPADTSKSAPVTEHALPAIDLMTTIKDIVKGTTEKLDLTEANIIVSGGRGLKEAVHFKMLEDLAQVLGATVGASRAVVDAGWVGHGMQVGQTGKTVAPSLYIAVGISGAIQHLAGMSGSKVIVAINNDPNAPIFQKATYGIVGDAFDIVPKLTAEFKKALH